MKQAFALATTALLLVISSPATAHDINYLQIVVPGNPAYIVSQDSGIKTVEKQTAIDGGVFSEYWEFTGGKIVYMTFIRWSRGESFEVILPRKDVGLTPETADELQRASQILHLYLSSEVP